jgi:hypothetical protein
MPSTEQIQIHLTGVWRMMTGKPDGIRFLDLSADGFWNSFFAIVVALPALMVGWVGIANELGADPLFGSRVSILLRTAIVDIGSWVLPLLLLGIVAGPAGLRDRFVHYVVASNWASALIVWLMLPATLTRLFAPELRDFADLLSLAIFGISLILTWRLTNAAIGKGPVVATGVFAGMFVASVIVLLALQAAVGLTLQDQIPA